ncbi:MAG: hypothetical protein JRI68_25295 [Deltaproteobacteria bacterium]|nr:hypothetical protein [Deltaproteobacteria bacterium]
MPDRISLSKQTARVGRAVRSIGAPLAFGLVGLGLIGCPSTVFIKEGSGQPTDRASGKAPQGSVGACRERGTKRPPVVNAALWENLKPCTAKTPRRYLRLGYGKKLGKPDEEAERRMTAIMESLTSGATEQDGNTRMLGMLRTVRRQALDDPKLAARVERDNSRTFACDYSYLLNTTQKEYEKLEGNKCPAAAYDPKQRADVCLFDTSVKETVWLTSAWSCLAFTDTVGEGGSCYRLCAYNDYCAGQVSCAQADFDLVLCALGVCMPEKVAGLF